MVTILLCRSCEPSGSDGGGFAGAARGAGAAFDHGRAGGKFYGFARATKDADIILEMASPAFDRFVAALPEALEFDPQVSFETITGSRRHLLKLRNSAFRIELFALGQDPHHRERFVRRRERFLPELNVAAWIATAEDMVIPKLRWNRDKDRDDARNILAVQGDALDFAYIEGWCRRHGTLERLQDLRDSIPPV